MSTNEDVLRIVEILDFRRQPESIKKKRARWWLESTDANVIGAGVDAIMRNWQCIEPTFTHRELGDLLMKNFQVSLQSGGEKLTHYAYSCHEAAAEFYRWVIASHAATDDPGAQECVQAAKGFLEIQYRAGDEPQRNCIVAGALEHLFEVEGLQTLFADWANDPMLSDAYVKATAWSSWAASRTRSLQSVAERTSQLLRRAGLESVDVRAPAIGTTMHVVTWWNGELNELAITCDEAWVRHFEAGHIDEEKAAKFAASANNWSESSALPRHFNVELRGEYFARR